MKFSCLNLQTESNKIHLKEYQIQHTAAEG